MDKQTAKKRAKLVELKRKLSDGEHVQNRQLKTWLYGRFTGSLILYSHSSEASIAIYYRSQTWQYNNIIKKLKIISENGPLEFTGLS